jgi:DNA-binding NtrC family response regulator
MKWVSLISSKNRRKVIRAAQNDLLPVYLSGEAGTGKSAIARWIHANSPRSMKPFSTLAPGESLPEKARSAESGTLVIQDIDRFPSAQLAEIRSFLRSHSIKDGENGVRTLVRARVIATGESPFTEGSIFTPFFADFSIHLPSLNDRKEELLDLIENLFAEMSHELGKDHVRVLSPNVIHVLMEHRWKGNLRELRNILRYAILCADSGTVETEHLPDLQDPSGILLFPRSEFAAIEESLIKGRSS